MSQLVLVEAHIARLKFEMGKTLKPWNTIIRSFITLDQAVMLVESGVCIVRAFPCLGYPACMCMCALLPTASSHLASLTLTNDKYARNVLIATAHEARRGERQEGGQDGTQEGC